MNLNLRKIKEKVEPKLKAFWMKLKRTLLIIAIGLAIVLMFVSCSAPEKKMPEKVAEVVSEPTMVETQCIAISSGAMVWPESSTVILGYGKMPEEYSVTYGMPRALVFGEFHKGEYRHFDVVGVYVEDLRKLGLLGQFPKGIEEDADGIIWFHDGEAMPF